MKVSLILECQAEGPDEKVLRCLLTKFTPHIELDVATLGSKPNLEQSCGPVARRMLEDGCEHVVILWDLYPAEWGDALRQKNRTPCLHEDRQRIHAALQAAQVEVERVFLVAIKFMLESWLIADKRAIAAFLSRSLRREITAQQVGAANPATERRPKDTLSKMFERHSHPAYRDFAHAEKIAQEVEGLDDLKRHSPSILSGHPSSFQRFWEKATGEQ